MTVYHHEFSRENIETHNIEAELARLRPWLTDSKKLLRHYHRTTFGIPGYEIDSRDLHDVPFVRTFFVALNQAFPYLLSFTHPSRPAIRLWLHIFYLEGVDMGEDGAGPKRYRLTYSNVKTLFRDLREQGATLVNSHHLPAHLYFERSDEMRKCLYQYFLDARLRLK